MVLKNFLWNLKGRLKSFASLFLMLCVAEHALAWDKTGHQWVGQSAAIELPPKVQKYYESLIKEGVVVPPQFYHSPLAARIGALSSWPEGVQDETLEKIYKVYGASQVPAVLTTWAQKTPSDLSRADLLLLNEKGGPLEAGKCTKNTSSALVDIWPALLEAYGQAKTGREKNVTLALALNLVANAYQPLHLSTAMNKQCESDQGGQLVCILAGQDKKSCAVTLYKVWEEGFGIFTQPHAWPTKKHPLNFLKFDDALKLAKKAALDVYPADGKYDTPEYLANARKVSIEAADYAVGHSVFLLKYLMANDASSRPKVLEDSKKKAQ